MAKYTSDTNLIKGAATAYRNYDNAAGMYSGLDKVTQAGMGVVDEAVKGYEAEQEKLEKEARKAQAKADKLNDNWNTLASGVYESAGSFMKDVEYKDTVASVKTLRQEYIDAQNSKDAEKMAEVKIKFNNINTEITAHKEFRAKLAHPEYGMSDFVTGDNREYMNGFINEDYVIGRDNKTKEKTYTVNGVTKTMEEINKMVDVKNMKPYGDYGKLLNDYSTSKTKGNKNNLLLAIRNGIVPDQTNPLRAFLNDKGFGNGQTFSDLLKTDVNRASIEKEIMGGAFDNEEDSKGVISKSEYDNFINAIVNPDNEFWKNNGGASAWKDQSRTIATELLANGAENAWDTNPNNIETDDDDDDGGTKTNTNPYGFTGKEIRIGPTKGGGSNAYQDRMDVAAATTLIGKIEKGKGFPFGSNNYNYLFDEKTGEGAWHEFKPGEAINKSTETSFIGSAQDLESSIFRTNLPQFQNLETIVDNSKSLSLDGNVIEEGDGNLNPFSVGEIPQDFINAVSEGDEELVEYIKNNFKDIPDLSASGAGIGSDKIVIGMGGKGKNRKTEIFTTKPLFASDEDRAAEIWNWMKSNYSSKKKYD